jgi:N-acetylneuraminate synthase/N,N'-diacetyllegionaminate synthase
MEKITIGNSKIGPGEQTFIIAEAGLNHDGDFTAAKKLVIAASKTGADVVKFQIFKTENFISEDEEYFDLFKSLEFTQDEWSELANLAEDKEIIFSASVFDEESAEILNDIGAPLYKISSGDLTHIPLLAYVSKKNLPVILSTGIATIGEIEESLNNMYKSGNQQIALMHCVSNYPTKYEDTNLSIIKNLKEMFDIPVGFSDHTTGVLIPSLAVAKGADIIEKHFTLNKNLPGPDHKLSLDPVEFEQMVKNIRITESALGDGVKKITGEEEEMKGLGRRSITSTTDIHKGEKISKDKIKILRPGTGIEPKYIDFVVGKTASKDIKKNQTINWDLIC